MCENMPPSNLFKFEGVDARRKSRKKLRDVNESLLYLFFNILKSTSPFDGVCVLCHTLSPFEGRGKRETIVNF